MSLTAIARAMYGQGVPQNGTPEVPVRQSIIPRLDPQFFNSRFYARFHIQRPIIEPEEFKARYIAFFNGSPDALGIAGQLIAMLFVIWAASYGVDHCGKEDSWNGFQGIQYRKQTTNAMMQELLCLIDIHGILRKPSWDGVRVLLLAMPLTEEVAEPLERLTIYETAINQVYTLCSLASPRSVNSGQGDEVDAMVRARIYWEDDDLATFQDLQHGLETAITRSELNISYTRRWALAPLRLASACRRINAALTGAKARARQDINEEALKQAWESIENCWVEFESLRQLGLLGILTKEEADRFVDGWKIFIFECHNVIREYLKQRLLAASGEGGTGYIMNVETREPAYNSLLRLHAIAEAKCQDVAQHVLSLVRRHIGTSFFAYDASLVRDGCFFAGYMLSGDELSEEQYEYWACFQRGFSKSEERIQTLRMIWETKKTSLTDSNVRRGMPPSPPVPPSPLHRYGEYPSSEVTAIHSTLTTPSPGMPSMSYKAEEDQSLSYNCPSVSSGSSTLSTDSPYSPSVSTSNHNVSVHIQNSKSNSQYLYPTESNSGPFYHDTRSDGGTHLTQSYVHDVKAQYHNLVQEPFVSTDQHHGEQPNLGVQPQLLEGNQTLHPYHFSYEPYPH
ncbi:hypothetical protein Clacol_006501 [Clathrus columnatus]|uniref:Uncharacterized protein n=1 Tax=Clathrus columnatus TaxID=1419009 RepID=A0AAV5AH98_9AGAM|nr:hypothetical protein Clacol_006501 [Clathrus columnatus]